MQIYKLPVPEDALGKHATFRVLFRKRPCIDFNFYANKHAGCSLGIEIGATPSDGTFFYVSIVLFVVGGVFSIQRLEEPDE